MTKVYHRVFRQAENISAPRIVLPLMGTGVAASADNSLAVRALVASVLSYIPRGHLTIIVVSKDKKILDETETQFLYQRQYPEKQKGIIERASMFITECREPFPHRSFQPPERNAQHKVADREKNKGQTRFATDKELQQVLKQSAQEAKNNIKPVHRQARSETRDHYKDRPYSKYSNDDYDLQRAIELSKKETGSVVSPGPTPDSAATLREDTSMGDEITCPICLCCISDPKQLDKCGHLFCRVCIERRFRDFKPVCPSCNMVYGVITGNQPDGLMDVGFSGEHLPGYETYGTITITYSFPNGRQKAGDPSPGQPYKGTTRRAYLPANTEGKEILALLKTAFERRLTFTIGRSITTGQDGVVTWNDIHHKTNVYGGPTRYGYPDPTYLSRVRDELASKGVTRSTGPSSTRQQTSQREIRNITLKELTESSNNHVKGNRKTYKEQPKVHHQFDDASFSMLNRSVLDDAIDNKTSEQTLSDQDLATCGYIVEIQGCSQKPTKESMSTPRISDKSWITKPASTLSFDRVLRSGQQSHQNGVPPDVPPTWSRSSKDTELVTLLPESAEFQEVQHSFLRSIGSLRTYNVIQIKRVQSSTLWDLYKAPLRKMEQRYPDMTSERRLWHGTSAESIHSICIEGFNRSFCGKNAARYGEGTYFSPNSSYAAEDTYSVPADDGIKHVFRARVLTGRYTKGESGMKVPPYLNEKESTRFDSVVDNVDKPNLFVIFHDAKAYPEYLIKFI